MDIMVYMHSLGAFLVGENSCFCSVVLTRYLSLNCLNCRISTMK